MPTNKNAVTRYRYIDEILSDRYNYHDIHQITEYVNQKLIEQDQKPVSQRCVEKDIKALEFEPFYADIERIKDGRKSYIRYEDPTFSIFAKKLSREEEHMLSEVLNTIGQFDGLNNFEWMDTMKTTLGLEERERIIYFSTNPYLKNSNLLGSLFSNIANKQVIKLTYHSFGSNQSKNIIFHPFILKEYNNRWFVIGSADSDGFILTYALDRIVAIEPQPKIHYREKPENFEERFNDIIGVTLHSKRPVDKIILWIDDHATPYVDTKPLHGSQIKLSGEALNNLRKQYPSLTGGNFFSLSCIQNNELITTLASYLGSLVVLYPPKLQEDILNKLEYAYTIYSKLRK